MEALFYGNVLTGGIATGKSTVASLLKLHGFAVIDADSIGHSALEAKAEQIIAEFGESILNNDSVNDSKINRKELGKIVFANPAKLQCLESIVHPYIAEVVFQQSSVLESKKVPFFVDIPIYFEKQHLFSYLQNIVLVYAPLELQISRLQSRNNFAKDEAMQRINAQIPIDLKKQKTADIIHNIGDLQELQAQVEQYLEALRKKYDL